MIVRVYDFLSAEKPKFSQNLVGIVSDVESFKYTRRAYDIGSFEMTIPTHADEAGCIQPDRMLIVGEKLSQTYIASDPTKRIVRGTFLYVTDIEKKDDKITVTGYDLKYLFALRVTLFPKEEQDKGTYGYYVTSGTTFSCISDIINYNIVNATDSDRQIYGMFGITMPVNQINADPPLTGIQDDRYMTRLEPVSTAIFNLLKNCKTHFYDMRLIIDDNAEDGDSYNPHMESSEDKPVIIIDESRYNIKSYTRKDGTSAYKNAIYAVVGSGDDVTVKCVKRPDDTASGVKRKEVVLDVDTDSVAEIDRYALKAAEEYVISDDFEIEPLFMDDETEPELAQKVSIRIDGVEYETVITEITDEYANGKHTQSYVCGDKKLKVLNVLNKATAGNTQKIINNKITTGNAGGVGEFSNADKNCEVFNDYENNVAGAYYSHAEGYKTTANAPYSHAEGRETVAYNMHSHAEGYKTVAGGQSSHAEGEDCRATGNYSHAEGHNTVASGTGSHASGWGTVAGDTTFAIGRWNKTSDGLFVVGNGWNYGSDESDASRSDALVLDGSGNLHIAGKLTADGGVGYVLPSATADTLGGVKIGDNISVTADGVVSVDLSGYLKSDEISDWAKADNKPTYTASEIGLGNVDNTADKDKPISTATQKALDGKADTGHTHTVSDIIDMPAYLTEETDPTVPAWAKAKNKPTYTADEVGAATAADITAAVNAVEIGGRNVVTGSAKLTIGAGKRPKGHWRQSGPVTLASTSASGVPYADDLTACVLTSTTINASGGIVQDGVPLSKDEYYTLSCWVKNTSAKSVKFILQPFWKSNSDFDRKVFILNESAEWQRISYTSSKKPETSDVYAAGAVLLNADTVGASIQVCGVKLEKGNKPTDWTPAPEDDEWKIASLEARVAALEAMAVSGGEV